MTGGHEFVSRSQKRGDVVCMRVRVCASREGIPFGFKVGCVRAAARTHAPHPSIAVTLARQRDFNQTGPSI